MIREEKLLEKAGMSWQPRRLNPGSPLYSGARDAGEGHRGSFGFLRKRLKKLYDLAKRTQQKMSAEARRLSRD